MGRQKWMHQVKRDGVHLEETHGSCKTAGQLNGDWYVPPVLVAGITEGPLGRHLSDGTGDSAVRARATLTLHTYNNHTDHIPLETNK
jgi:hypothetical protein